MIENPDDENAPADNCRGIFVSMSHVIFCTNLFPNVYFSVIENTSFMVIKVLVFSFIYILGQI